MRSLRLISSSLVLLIVCVATVRTASAQQRQSRPEDVVRVNTELVQTDVMVFAKDGSFVEGLKREQFELKIDGKAHAIAFFERVSAGSRNEEAQLAVARGGAKQNEVTGAPVPLDRGRAVFFYLDDLHLSASSITQTRALLRRFVDHEMGQNDEVAIVSATGQIGFLQQLTNNKEVLTRAIERVSVRPVSGRDAGRPPMTEYQATLVEQNDSEVIDVFIDALLRDNPGLPRQMAGDMVRQRASAIAQQAAHFTTISLASLEGLVRSAAPLSGRKLFFLISDGFLLDQRNSNALDRMRLITSEAARSGIVIYSLDARGLIASAGDLTGDGVFDPSGRLQRASAGEIYASQDGLNALARDTGGRAIFNTNALSTAVTTAVKETSVYYLLAWRPDNDEQRGAKFKRIEVNIVGRPQLLVRVRPNPVNSVAIETAAGSSNKSPAVPKTAGEDLRQALTGLYPTNTFPVSLAVHFLNLPDIGTVIGASMKIHPTADAFEITNGKPTAAVDVAGVVFDDQGRRASGFQEHLVITSSSPDLRSVSSSSLIYNYRAALKPGLYQVRVAARDQKSGQTGAALAWIEVPDLTARHLALSSIISTERLQTEEPNAAGPGMSSLVSGFSTPRLNIEHRVAHSSRLGFLFFTYNAAIADPPRVAIAEPSASISQATPDLAVQVQVIRDNEPVLTTTLRKIETAGTPDLTRVPYAAEIPLQALPVGRYLLKVTVIDRIAKSSASQQLSFQVD